MVAMTGKSSLSSGEETLKGQMEEIYQTFPPEKIPWNIESPPDALKQLVETGRIKPCKAVEFGCGAGNYVTYLASLGFDATGIDFSETAIEIARRFSSQKDANCTFLVADVLGDMSEINGMFDFAYDWELLHHIFPPDREKYAQTVYDLLNPGGRYLSVCFSEDSPQFGGQGKYRITPLNTVLYFSSEDEIESLFTPLFDIEDLKTIDVVGKFSPHKAIYSLMIKK
jgi:SAM-dependent methyltransferase